MAYSVWQRFITDGGEKIVASALISVYSEDSGAPATIYDGPSGSPLGNTTTSDINGLARFFAPAGTYKIVASKGSFSAEFRHVQLGNAQSYDVGPNPDNLVTQADLEGATAYIPVLSVTVGTGGDYEEFDDAYAALAGMRIGTLTLAISGTHDNTLGDYTFGNCDNVNITFNAATFANPLFLSAYSINYADLGKNTIGGTLNGSGVFFAKGFSFLNGTTLNYGAGYIILMNCSGIGQLNLNATGAILITGNCPEEPYGTINANKYVIFEGNQTVETVNSPEGVECASGTISLFAVNNTAAEEVGVLVTARLGASVTIGPVDCGANGVTTVFEARGGDIYAHPSAAGTYTNLYSQTPGISTKNGMIYAEFDPVQTSSATSGTVTLTAGKTRLKLTGALAATLTIDGTAIVDGSAVTVYSTNGITALTVTGGTVLGFMPSVGAGGIFTIERAGAELWVS